MIRNIIFDMGQVLIRFNTEVFLDRFASDCTPEERTLLLREVYLSAEWIMQDRGKFCYIRLLKKNYQSIWIGSHGVAVFSTGNDAFLIEKRIVRCDGQRVRFHMTSQEHDPDAMTDGFL